MSFIYANSHLAFPVMIVVMAVMAFQIFEKPHFTTLLQSLDLGFSTTSSLSVPNTNVDTHNYQVQVFSTDPLILYIKDFVSKDEIDHLLKISSSLWEPTPIYPNGGSYVDLNERVSESAVLPRDDTVRLIEKRARRFQGWRGNTTRLQRLKTQRYFFNGFYNFHYDWDPQTDKGNRVTTFMVYLLANCTGGGTNFPYLDLPANDKRWCDVVECWEGGEREYEGVTFKPIEGAAVFWENMHPNGSLHMGVMHAALPVSEGVKVGLNIWGWDHAWRKPENEWVGFHDKLGLSESSEDDGGRN